MLKIKDNIDLKELAKFGFHFRETIMIYWDSDTMDNITIEINDRAIRNFELISHKSKTGDILFDLIKADLVEKVEE